jgi:hypothetical protein
MHQTMIRYAVAWMAIGIAAGLTAVLPPRRGKPIWGAVLAAAAAGILAALVFVPVSWMLFPTQRIELAVPGGTGNRILWTCLPAVLMALVAGRTLARRSEATPA